MYGLRTGLVEIKCNEIWGNEWGDYGCSNAVPGSNGNIFLDPLFCNGPARDLRLQPNSPGAPDQNVCGVVLGALPVGCQVLDVPAPATPFEKITLAPIRPNPSSATIQVQFEIARQAELRLEIFDAAGRRCAVLADRSFEAGRHALTWSGKDTRGRAVRAGVYLAVLRSGDLRRTQTFVVIH